MFQLQRFDLLLRFFRHHAFAVQLAVGAGVRLVARRQQVGGDIAFTRDIGHDFDFFFNFRQFGEEFRLGIAFQHVFCDGIACVQGLFQARHIRVIKENLGFQHFCGVFGNGGIVTQGQIQQDVDGGATLHMGQQLKGEGRGDFLNAFVA